MSYANQKIKDNPLPAMPKKWRVKLDEILRIQSSSENEKMMYFYLRNWLDRRNISNYTDQAGNLICQKGEGDMQCIVSHMDTVHAILDEYDVLYKTGNDGNTIAYAKSGKHNAGVGGDDKNGIFACLYMLTKLENIKVVFFSREESGLVGSSTISHKVFDNCGSIIQLDRWGAHDFISIYYGESTVSKEFSDIASPIMKDYGYEVEEGLITDSINLFDDGVGISCINVSCGYYSHHSNVETIDINELWNSVLFTETLINSLGDEKYVHFSKFTTSYKPNSKYSYYDDWYDDYSDGVSRTKVRDKYTPTEIDILLRYDPYAEYYLECRVTDSYAVEYIQDLYDSVITYDIYSK